MGAEAGGVGTGAPRGRICLVTVVVLFPGANFWEKESSVIQGGRLEGSAWLGAWVCTGTGAGAGAAVKERKQCSPSCLYFRYCKPQY